MKSIIQMKSAKSNGIYFEYSFTERSDTEKKTLVILSGIPSQPKQYDFFTEFLKNGFDIIYPRYEGTWESDGEFLTRNPVESIQEFIDTIHTGITIENSLYRSQAIFVLGSSFGGGVGLSISDQDYIKAVCALSPVISFRRVKGIETLESYLKSAFPNEYRFQENGWQKLTRDDFYCPSKLTNIPSEKIILVAGKDDTQLSIEDLEEYTNKYKISNFVVTPFKHITLGKLDSDTVQKIITFFNSIAITP